MKRRLRRPALGAFLTLAPTLALALAPTAAARGAAPNLGTPYLTGAVPLPLEVQLGKSDHKKLVKAIDEYYTARNEDKGVLEAREELDETIEKIEKKAKSSVLAMVEDLELVMSRIGDKSDRVDGKGKVDELELGGGALATVHAPKSYKADDGPWPLVIAIHDEGQKPADLLRDDWISTEAATGAVLIAPHMPDDVDTWTAPVSEQGGLRTVMMSMGSAVRNYSIDPNRIYVVGRGAGVPVAAEVASLYPDRFAAVVGRAGDLGTTPPDNFGTIASLWVGGSGGVDAFTEALGEMGLENFRKEGTLESADIWSWCSEQARTANPAELGFRPRTDRSDSCFWLKFEGIDSTIEGTGASATVDRESNTITLEVTGMTNVTVYLNDVLVDLDKPVRVLVNGVEHETQFDRNLSLLLERVYRSGDPGRIFTATRSFDVPEAE